MHHHSIAINSAFMDKYILTNVNKFLEIIKNYRNIKLVVFGNVHQEFPKKIYDIDFFGSPSASIQFKPNVELFEIDNILPGYREISLYEV